MPLPEGSSSARVPWPPESLTEVQDKITEWAAWYSGEADQLSEYYTRSTSTTRTRPRPGLRKVLRRLWWGTPTPTGETLTKVHIPVAGDLATLSADLLFGELPSFTVPGHPATQERIDLYIENGLYTDLHESAEVQSALGGVFLRVVWDTETFPDHPWIAVGQSDSVVAEWRWNRLHAATFWRILDSDATKVIRHLERHEKGKILHGVYEGTKESLGRRVALTEYPDLYEALKPSLVDGDTIETDIGSLTAVYIPNVRPNRVWRNVPEAQNLGRSDFQSVIPAMDSLDEAYSSWIRDLRLGKARLIVPQTSLMSKGAGQGAEFNLDQELFMGLDGLTPEPGTEPITQIQFKIRAEEHEKTIMHWLSTIVRSAGYGMLDFSGESPGQGMTATETNAKGRRTLTTRDRKIAYWTRGLREILDVLLQIDAAKFGADVEPQAPNIEFPDAVSPDPMALAETAKVLAEAKIATTATLVEMVHPDWDAKRISAEVAELDSVAEAAREQMLALAQKPAAGDSESDNGQPGADPFTSPGG